MIKSDKIELVPATLDDRRKIYKWCFQSETTKYHAGPPDYPNNPIPTYEEFCSSDDGGYTEYYFTGAKPNDGRGFLIVHEDEAVGFISYCAFHLKSGIAELDIWMNAEANCGNGFGVDALITLSNYLKTEMGIRIFWLFGIVEILLTLPVFVQSLRQIAGIVIADIKNKPMPDKDNFVPKVRYSLPFYGAWVAVNGGVTKEISHSWEINSQRYAYDFIILDDAGKSYSGDTATLSSYYCYGKEILAPADGVVVEVRTDCRDSKIMGGGKTDPLVKDIRGNYIVIQHAENEYSCLAHFMPDSITVSVGERVKRKQQIALCGNSGNTSEPHLHFQIQNGKSFFNSAGLPIHFEQIEAAPQTQYSTYDPRPIPTKTNESDFISRGQCVKNK